jgi:hypothetical protein
LPPRLEKHLERNGTLAPGLQKRIEPCPEELDRQLPSLPAEYQRAVIGAHFVVFNRNTKVIVEVMQDVVGPVGAQAGFQACGEPTRLDGELKAPVTD